MAIESAKPDTVTGVFRLPWVGGDKRYESALAFELPATLEAQVYDLRRSLDIRAPSEHQLPPHLTLLYLGRMWGSQLAALAARLEALRNEKAGGRLEGLGFFDFSGRRTNVHVRIDPDPSLLELHERALDIGRQFDWFEPGRFVGADYVPHVSILDRISSDDCTPQVMCPEWAKAGSVRLANLHMMAKRLDEAPYEDAPTDFGSNP